ncbi:MAG: 4-hydroxy-tetrahydrodipicolinate synthase (EC [uncultured Campylobacterales bacterium]|uniref:4-hydroxy-tetrahydrodipicolinate synthase n=1 Tax=uncultured Campylobacterales bacterium TaxID=352960 RepID=A0A6S6SWK3_9BACT|nr:MAG: 4-hydroxy-tetrahydrodipicolinate synthase (EC [uncultured Campylobacterales bacterium]
MISGSMTALITPFKNNKLDTASYEKLINRQIKNGIDCVVPVGTTGESATLSHTEHKECIEIAVNLCKDTKTKVLAGAGSNATHESVDLAKFASDIGADAVLSVTPYYNKPTQEGLYLHYKEIASNIDIPVVMYNVPSRTGVDLSVETTRRLYQDIENIVSIKDATGDISRVVELSTIDGLGILSGDDAINCPVLASGGNGVISVTSNLLPDMISEMVDFSKEGYSNKANDINKNLLLINKVLFCESNPIPIKAAMYIAGLIDTLEFRLPLVGPSVENLKLIEKTILKYSVKGL